MGCNERHQALGFCRRHYDDSRKESQAKYARDYYRKYSREIAAERKVRYHTDPKYRARRLESSNKAYRQAPHETRARIGKEPGKNSRPKSHDIMNFPTGEYKTVVIDPPWPVKFIERREKQKQIAIPYKTMPVAEIAALPIIGCLSKDALVFVWTTQKFLPIAFGIIAGWGLKYRWTLVWRKPDGFQPFNCPKFNGEFVVAAARGNPHLVGQTDFWAIFDAPRRGHSVKPAEFYNTLARVTEPPRLDIFSRRLIPGFDVWGDEAPTETLECSQYPLFDLE